MAPSTQKTKSGGEKMKQQSLMSFFNKPSTTSSAVATPAKSKAQSSKNARATDASSTHEKRDTTAKPLESLKTPSTPAKSSSQMSGAQSPHNTHSSNIPSSPLETPPTSDVIDVDMMSVDEEEDVKPSAARSKKRKVLFQNSDEENPIVGVARKRKGLPDDQHSPPPIKAGGRLTKVRKLATNSDHEDEDGDEDKSVVTAFSTRLTKFKPSAPSRPKRRALVLDDDDDDDFIGSDVAERDDEDDEPSSRPESRASSGLSDYAYTSASEFEVDGDIEAPVKKERQKIRRPELKKQSGSKKGSSDMFLTDAERRVQKQKEDKKSSEDPFDFLQDVRDKDGIRPGQPGYDPRTLFIPAKAWKTFTPFEKQFWEIKQNHFDTILFFQKGKFLELYEEDARVGHQEFDLKLTQRVKMSMVGVPEQSFNFWAAKFLAKGYKVGRVDQAETALGAEMRVAADKGKGKAKLATAEDKGKDKIVRRELNKVYTNGTLVDEALLTDEQAGHCISIREDGEEDPKTGKQKFGFCVLDSSTSEFNLSAFEDDICRTRLETMMRQLRPKEIIYTKGNLSVPTTRSLKAILPGNCLWTSLREVEGLSYDKTVKELKVLYPPSEDDDMDDCVNGMGSSVPDAIRSLSMHRGAIEALGSMIWYLRTLNIDKDILSMKNFNIYDPMKKGTGLVLDGQTLAHIEVLLNNEGTDDGSLLRLLGHCITPSGKRLFRIWLCNPLRDIADINTRLDAVEDLMEHPTFESEFREIAKGLPDLERIVSRIHAKNCRVKDFLKVLEAFKNLSKGLNGLANTAESFKSKSILGLLRAAPDLLPHLKHVKSMFTVSEEKDELIPEDGKDETYDTIMAEIQGLEEQLDQDLETYEEQVGCKLTYWHSAQGTKEIYLVQTKPNEKNIPRDWVKTGGTKAAARWMVPDLAPTIRSLKEAREHRNVAMKTFKGRVYAEFDADRSVWLRAVRAVSELDCLFSLTKASSALGSPSCRPEFIDGDAACVDFDDLRHPALSESAGFKGDFIPNNVKLGGDVARIALLTGPNMGGKSTVMRMTAAGVIMAQLGMYVPATKARLCPVDAILTRMGAYDNMFSNASTFKVELDECCKVLREATPRSLVILDELGRGTSTYDGMAIAGSVLHQLATHTFALSFFATHYGSLTDDFAYHPNIRNMHMATMVDDDKKELVFLYKLTEGVASSSFGTHVANLAGVPSSVVERADIVSSDFAKQFKEKVEGKKGSKAAARLSLAVQADFAYIYKIATGKCELPPDDVRKKLVLGGLKAAVGSYLRQLERAGTSS